ncbi:type VI secretion system baseplate subunit TssK [Paludibacterium purpuratum]|uniref:Type VI secretion system protein ImpJ n=1 Tax=Paludibacterium purpuratum TaxID=1144873 RepID=A0A4R7AU10_9NEIS|nr:type VI secretion system baseplate subunit TssK [Paludibacterium purpuratum]TDR70274.1 type VI secretion system protein ImpJ [Paludibacterium purpuratum]
MHQAKRVLWGEGMFLRPQNFQQQAQYHEQLLTQRLQLAQRHCWGIARTLIDEDGLKSGQLRLQQLTVLFRDGTLCQAPEHAPLPLSRDLESLPQLGVETTVYVCLADMQPYGGNVRHGDSSGRPTRFYSEQQEVADLFTQALAAEVATLELDVRLMVEEENRDGFDAVPLCRIQKNATGQWQLVERFLPPTLTIESAPPLQQMLRRLLEILLVKSQALAGAHRERSRNVLEFGPSDVGSFWLRHTVNRNFARLNHLARCSPLHPEELYQAMSEFCGELLTFSTRYELGDIPAYRHEMPGETFAQLDQQIRDLLDTVISSRHMVIPLVNTRQSFHIGHLESDRLVENVSFYLSVHSDQPASQIIESVPLKLKIGAPDDVEKILNSAMRGVALIHALQTPSALPVRVGDHYFMLEAQGPIYQRMLQSRSICIYVPETLAHLTLELIAVFN